MPTSSQPSRSRRARKRPMTVQDLWALPRVGEPVASPSGETFLVPVTQWSMDTNKSETRLWMIDTDDVKAGNRARSDRARPFTAEGVTSSSPAFSPDGTRVAFLRRPGGEKGDAGAPREGVGATKPGPKHPDQPQIYLQRTEGGEAELLTDLPFGANSPTWFPDGRRIAFFSKVYEDALTLEKTEAKKKERSDTPVTAHVTEKRFFRYWDTWLTENRVWHIFVLDTETNELVDLTPKFVNMVDTPDPHLDIAPDGREIAFHATMPPLDDLKSGIYTVKVPPRITKRTRIDAPKSLTPEFGAQHRRPVYSPDGRWILYGTQMRKHFYADRVRLTAYDRQSKAHTVLTEDWDHSASGWTFAPDGRSVYFAAEINARSAVWYVDIVQAARSPRNNPPEELCRGGVLSSPVIAGERFLCNVSHINKPPEIVSYDLEGDDRKYTTAFTEPGLADIEMSEHEEVYFRGANGDKVHMMVVYPPGMKKPAKGKRLRRKLPLVHMIHGGPHSTFGDQWHWRWCAQIFASPGYVCALVNFHGSTSWGQDYAASILGRWGDQPYEDIMKATDYLVERGIADPKKMAISGGSYGGYLTAWIASQTRRFKCAINHAGVSDLQTQYASDVTHGRRVAIGGEAWDDLEGLDRYNPMRYARGFHTPMLIVHGQKDYRVPYANAIETYNVYKAMGKKARLVVYPDENHWILSPRNSEHWYGEVLGWFRKYLGGK